MIGSGVLFDAAAQSAYEAKTLSEIDYEHALTTGGMFAPFGLLGKGVHSTSALIRGGSYAAIGGFSALGAGSGGADIYQGIRDSNWAQASFGVSEVVMGGFGLRAAWKYAGGMTTESPSGHGYAPCFAAGTQIQTADGLIPIPH